MFVRLTKVAAAGVVGILMFSPPLLAQGSGFDSQKFFGELQARGVKMDGFNSQKFFEEIAANGASSQNQLDPEKFFSELQARGASAPAGFDANKFFDEIQAKGVKAPDMVKTAK